MQFSAETHQNVKKLTSFIDEAEQALVQSVTAAQQVHAEAKAKITQENLEIQEQALAEFRTNAQTIRENIAATDKIYQALGEDLKEY